ncbi:MAG: hypothetical protein HKP27_15855, partial [Myxococcales bacterium]|nr:hypothetical protein [Myxococcales bacterium]
MQTSERSSESVPWARLCLGVSGALILITGANVHLPALSHGILRIEDVSTGWRLLQPFNLADENNLAVWWSGALLSVAGLLCFQQVDGRGALPARSAAILAALLVGLSCDEVVSIHERVSLLHNLYPVPFAALGAGLLIYALMLACRNPASRGVALRVFAGFALLGSVAVQEYLEHTVSWPSWLAGVRVAVEEGSELFGMFIILHALVTDIHGRSRVGVRQALPKPSEFPILVPLLALGLGLQLASASLVFSHLDDLTTRGNATSWYCATAYLVAAFRVNERELGGRSSLFFFTLVLCSLDAV